MPRFAHDEPRQGPDGRLYCHLHGLEICGVCRVDYALMPDVSGSEYEDDLTDDRPEGDNVPDEEHDRETVYPGGGTHTYFSSSRFRSCPSPGDQVELGTGRVIPTAFVPPNSSTRPEDLFKPAVNATAIPHVHRFIRKTNHDEFLIYTDGACLSNSQSNPRAGCAFVFKPVTSGSVYFPGVVHKGDVSFRLENRGPTGEAHEQTSNRAELRAVIAALQFRYWTGEGFSSLVIATDSEYVVKGITTWVGSWFQRGWVTSSGQPVKNKDLWLVLLGEVERWDDNGMKIKFWRIPCEWNTLADTAAKEAAQKEEEEEEAEFTKIMGVLV